MSNSIPKATHTGTVDIGSLSIPCAVLEDGRRVLSERGVMRALGRHRGSKLVDRAADSAGGGRMPFYIAGKVLEPYVDADFAAAVLHPIEYRPSHRGRTAYGVPAEVLPKICEVWLKAREAGALTKAQSQIAARAELLLRGFAHVGIIALVDEATGYQKVRDRDALQRIIEAYVNQEFLRWTRAFPDGYYRELFRLKEWPYSPPQVKRPGHVGYLTNALIYEQLPPGVLDELRRVNPVTESGRRRRKHHQHLTEDIGHPHLQAHLAAVMALMRAAPNWGWFTRAFRRAFPKPADQIEFDLDNDEGGG